MTLDKKIEQAHRIIDGAIAEHAPVKVYVGLSGGYDSLTVAHIVMNHVPGAECFHINTGIGIERTRQFVRDTCEVFGWPLVEIRAKEDCGQDYRELVLDQGFPGPGMHHKMYQRLKERGVRLLVKWAKEGHGRNDRVMLVTGIRRDESQRRMGYDQSIVDKIGSQVWVNAIYWFTGQDKMDYVRRFDLPRNPVADTLGMSGECLCGAYAHKGEKELVRIVAPETAKWLDELEEEVAAVGWAWGWEDTPPKARILERYGQLNAFAPLCVGCEKTHSEAA